MEMENDFRPEKILKSKMEMTINCKYGRFYLKKRLREQFVHSVELMLDPENPRELLIKEKETGLKKSAYYSRKLADNLSESVGVCGNMRFLFFKDECRNIWYGRLIPDMEPSYLWTNVRNVIVQKEERYESVVIHALREKYGRAIERDEILQYINIGYQLAFAEYAESTEKKIWECALLYTSSLLEKMRKIELKYRKAEARISLDKPIKPGSSCTLGAFFGREDPGFRNLIVEDFKQTLTDSERKVLNLLMYGRDIRRNINWGKRLKNAIQKTREHIQEKAWVYFGVDYIKSILVMG